VGNNPEATRLTGIPVDRVLLGVYVLAGLFYGIASLLSVARTGVGDPNAGQTETWTPSPPWCWAAPACLAAAA
jgi:fructose transport system permease protein